MSEKIKEFSPIVWRDDALYMLDQRLLPDESRELRIDTVEACARAITDMVVRGAPAIGISAAYGVVLAARHHYRTDPDGWRLAIMEDLILLARARPTAVNLAWAIERMKRLIACCRGNPVPTLLEEAQKIHREDIDANHAMARFGAALIERGVSVITHCNAGALATGGYGTALGVIREAWKEGKLNGVFADETRPWLQGSRLTAWELAKDGIPVNVIADSAAASFLRDGDIAWVIVGADRVAANGDIANKIGTYALAVAARHHGVRVMVAAPLSTVDLDCPSGADIPIENRDGGELWNTAAEGEALPLVEIRNPAFDITPASLIDVFVTEKGAVEPPSEEGIRALFEGV